MLEKIRVRRRSNEVISTGDVVNYRKATFVVINILSIKVVPRATGEFIYYDCFNRTNFVKSLKLGNLSMMKVPGFGSRSMPF